MATDDPLCTEQFQNSAIAALKVVPEPGYGFNGWIVDGAHMELTSATPLFLATKPVLAGDVTNVQVKNGSTELQADCEPQTVYLTFDDGPLYGTDDIIRLLGEEEVEGTFFMVGVHITQWGIPYVKAAYSDFEIGNHSYSHPWKADDVNAFYTGPPEVVLQDLRDNDVKLSNILELSSPQQFVISRLPTKNIWRLPEIIRNDGSGQEAAELLRTNMYALYGWDFTKDKEGKIISLEWKHQGYVPEQSPQEMVERVERAFNYNPAKPDKVIVLMHDPMFRASDGHDILLKEFIQLLKERNYQLGAVSDY